MSAGHDPSGGIVAQYQSIAMQAGARPVERDGDEPGLAWREIAALPHQHAPGQAGGTEMDMHAAGVTRSPILRRPNLGVNPLRGRMQ